MTQPSTGTVVAESRWSLAFIWLAFPALGAVAGWLLTVLAEWMTTLEWAPFQGPARLLDSAPEPAATIGAVAIGAIAGLVVAGMGAHEMLTVTVFDSAVALRTRGATRTLERSDISAAFRDDKDLVFLGRGSEELAREKSDLGTAVLEHAFRTHGYPWRADGDPHHDDYRRWVADTPDLPPGADALLRARQKALGRGDGDDANELRAELAKLGVVVRDRDKHQYVRRSR